MTSSRVLLFCSYSHADAELKSELERFLLPKLPQEAVYWSDAEILAGAEFDAIIAKELEASDVVILLLTQSYLRSDHCWNVERRRAMERHEAGRATVIPVLLEAVDWASTPLKRLAIIPNDLVPVSRQTDREMALQHVADEVAKAVESEHRRKRLSRGEPSSTDSVVEQGFEIGDEEFYCELLSSVVPVRFVGLTEEPGDIVLRFHGDPGQRRYVDIWLFVSTSITSRVTSNPYTEVMLISATSHFSTVTPSFARGFRAELVNAGTLVFRSVPLHELGALPHSERALRVLNLRVCANQMAFVGLANPTEVHVGIQISGVRLSCDSVKTATIERTFDVSHLRVPSENGQEQVDKERMFVVTCSGFEFGIPGGD